MPNDNESAGRDANLSSFEGMAEEAVGSGLADADREEIEDLLGQALYTDVLKASEQGGQPGEWAVGDYSPNKLAQRFLDFQLTAIRRQICQPGNVGLKPEYSRILKPGASKVGGLAGLSGALMALFNADPMTVVGPSTALYAALWLTHADLESWCALDDNR